jgi:hypothetical protein
MALTVGLSRKGQAGKAVSIRLMGAGTALGFADRTSALVGSRIQFLFDLFRRM